MNRDNLNKFIEEALAIQAREAKEAGTLGYMARSLVQATMPHRKPSNNEFIRQNGAFTLSILSPQKIGLPFGSIPRLLIAWVTTEAVLTKNRELILGDSLTQFMSQLDLVPTGGRWGTITRLREQMKRLFSAAISCTYDDGEHWAIKNVHPITQANLWWAPKSPNQISLFDSTLTLSEEFFNEVTAYPIPIDMDVIKAIKQSPMALDIYCWLTYRMSYLKKSSTIPWEALKVQFGADYAQDVQGTRNFKKAFLRELRKVDLFYRANVESEGNGLTLKPGRTHIQKHQKNKKDILIQHQKEIKKPTEEYKKILKRYENYKFNRVIEVIENELSKSEKEVILEDFSNYLSRKKLSHLNFVKNNLSESEKAIKEELYIFITNYWNHLLSCMKSLEDFIQTE